MSEAPLIKPLTPLGDFITRLGRPPSKAAMNTYFMRLREQGWDVSHTVKKALQCGASLDKEVCSNLNVMWHAVLRCAGRCHAVPFCAGLCHAVLCCAGLSCAMLCCAVLGWAKPCCARLGCAMLCLRCAVLGCGMLR